VRVVQVDWYTMSEHASGQALTYLYPRCSQVKCERERVDTPGRSYRTQAPVS